MERLILASLCVSACLISAAVAVPMDVFAEDLPYQDPLFVPNFVHELGTNIAGAMEFPPDEEIDAYDTLTDRTACHEEPGDDPAIPNALVIMTNKTGINWRHVWYVADGGPTGILPETTLSNYDGLVNGAWAFKIDWVGVNKPLVGESIAMDGIFQAGETWEFIIQDYRNILGLTASTLGSIGVPSGPLDNLSSGSIIAIPEPTTMLLLTLGGLTLVRRKKK